MFRFFCYRYPGAAVTRGGVNVVNEVVCGVEVRGTFEECGGFGAGRTAGRGWPMASASTSYLDVLGCHLHPWGWCCYVCLDSGYRESSQLMHSGTCCAKHSIFCTPCSVLAFDTAPVSAAFEQIRYGKGALTCIQVRHGELSPSGKLMHAVAGRNSWSA